MPGESLAAYFITFTTYGSRLPGDERGSVSRVANAFVEPLLGPNPGLNAKAREAMRFPEVLLDKPMRLVVERAIVEHSAMKEWAIHALNVRTNHVHVVVTAENEPPKSVLQQLKAWATRALRAQGLVAPPRAVWAAYGSARVIRGEENLAEVIDYVLFQQGDPLT